MSNFLTQIAARQRAEAKRKAERIAKRRAQRIARKIAGTQADGLDDLPLDVAVRIESLEPPAKPKPEPVPDDSVESLVSRMTAIRERIWRLQSLFAVSLSYDCAVEANRYLQLFQAIAAQLKAKDAAALDRLVAGHESLLLAPALPIKQTVPLSTQQLVELRWEASTQPIRHEPKRPSTGDGLDWMVS